jgi:tetratricopeptide (TPR) repeat protein
MNIFFFKPIFKNPIENFVHFFETAMLRGVEGEYSRAKQCFKSGDYATAKDIYQSVLEADSASQRRAQLNLARVYLKLSEFDECINLTKSLLETEGNSGDLMLTVDVRYLYATALMAKLERYHLREALKQLDLAIESCAKFEATFKADGVDESTRLMTRKKRIAVSKKLEQCRDKIKETDLEREIDESTKFMQTLIFHEYQKNQALRKVTRKDDIVLDKPIQIPRECKGEE